MRGVPIGEPTLDAGVAVIRLARAIGRHAYDDFPFHLGFERASHATVRAGGRHRPFGKRRPQGESSPAAPWWDTPRHRRRTRRTPSRRSSRPGSPRPARRTRVPRWSARMCPALHRTRARTASTRCMHWDRTGNRDCCRRRTRLRGERHRRHNGSAYNRLSAPSP